MIETNNNQRENEDPSTKIKLASNDSEEEIELEDNDRTSPCCPKCSSKSARLLYIEVKGTSFSLSLQCENLACGELYSLESQINKTQELLRVSYL